MYLYNIMCVLFPSPDYHLRIVFPDVLPSSSSIESGTVFVSPEACLRIEVTSRIYDTFNAIGGLSLYIKRTDDDSSDGALILHKTEESELVSETCEVDIPEGFYTVILKATGNRFSELVIESLHLQPGHCQAPRKYRI
jgi:hypothetical protein